MGSCSIQRRLHQPGLHIEWHSNKRVSKDLHSPNFDSKKTIPIDLKQDEAYTTSNSESRNLSSTALEKKMHPNRMFKPDEDADPMEREPPVVLSIVEERHIKTASRKCRTTPNEPMSPPKIPVSAYVFLALGFSLLGAGLLITIVFWISTASLIGLPIPVIIMLVAGIGCLIFAYNRAVNSFYRVDSNEKQQKQRIEKKAREPLNTGDKIFIGIAITLVLAVILTIIAT
jgi:hypothetical protein